MNNPNTKKSWTEARIAASEYSKSLSPYLPSLDADVSFTRERQTFLNTSHNVINEPKHISYYRSVFEPELSLSYIIFDFGKRKASSLRAKEALFIMLTTHSQ